MILVLAPACSRRAERLVGNERLGRGPGGLGETSRVTVPADRDTWVGTGTRNTGPVLLVARTAAGFEAVTHLKVAGWNIPDTTDATLAIRSVVLFAPSLARDTLNAPSPVTIELRADTTAWDGATIAWPRPAAAALLASATEDFLEDTLTLDLTAAAPLDSLKRWARDPASGSLLRLSLAALSGPGVAGYQAGALSIRIAYDHTVSGAGRTDIVDTRVTEDLYVHTPAASLPAGSEALLRLGGLEGLGVAVRFPSPTIPPGAAIQEVALLLPVDALTDVIPFLEDGRTVDLEIRTAGADWVESATEASALSAADATVASLRNFAYHGDSDSLLTIQLPASVARGWSGAPAGNRGLLITSVRGEIASTLWISSRESARAPRLRVSYTTPPKERF